MRRACASLRTKRGVAMSSSAAPKNAVAPRMRIRPAMLAGTMITAMLALAISGHPGASAQTNDTPANNTQANNAQAQTTPTKASGPKQVGPWTVTGWDRDSGPYCVAERLLPGAAGGGATLGFLLLLARGGYWLGLGSEDWEL